MQIINKLNKIKSPHYRVEFDIDNNPFDDGYLLPKPIVDNLYNKWEETRPLTGVSHYNFKFNLKTDFTGNYISKYDNPVFDANALTRSNFPVIVYDGAYVHTQTFNSTQWTVNHDLGARYVIVQVYNENFELINPESVNLYATGQTIINFNSEMKGIALVTRAEFIQYQGDYLETWDINHYLNVKYINSQLFDDDRMLQWPENQRILTTNYFQISGAVGYTIARRPDYIHTQTFLTDTWTIPHNLGAVGVIIDVYDNNDYRIKPESIVLNGTESATIYFNESISGTAIVKGIGNPSFYGFDEKFEGNWIIKIGNGENLSDWDYINNNDIKNPLLTIQCDTDNYEITNDGYIFTFQIPQDFVGYITEVGLWDINGEIALYSKIDNIYCHWAFYTDVTIFLNYK